MIILLEKTIKHLINNKNVIKEIKVYSEAKSKLDASEPFNEFVKKIAEIKNDFTWNEKINR